MLLHICSLFQSEPATRERESVLCNDSGNKCIKHTPTNQQPETSHGCEGECPAAVVGCKVDVVVYVVVVVLYVASRKHEAPRAEPKGGLGWALPIRLHEDMHHDVSEHTST